MSYQEEISSFTQRVTAEVNCSNWLIASLTSCQLIVLTEAKIFMDGSSEMGGIYLDLSMV